MRLLPIVLLFALLVYALIDCVRTPAREMPGGLPKPLWLAMVVLLVGVGPLAWIIVRLVAATENADPTRPEPSGPGGTRPTRRPPRRPAAPDDDPAFLARLEAERRRAAREQADGPAAPPTGDRAGDGPQGTGRTDADAGHAGPADGKHRPGAEDDPADPEDGHSEDDERA
ncbi:PLD nuclease N-terminal domain-containing protein [Georgenia sp. 10Sc9-8]|uniref:PLD nuclease N-terminal domain-containing protein n=1 Tax=Georgenia halotolerans TaxID=3028317 RepID=A0ABT5U2R8_9MICO|nr:PLD nuclease N-terminal domain-containing protein [Georgenia halotolerans]